MKQRLVPGQEIEAATPQEIGQLIAELLGASGRPQRPVRGEANRQANASGYARVPLYTVPLGMGFRLTRLYVAIDSATFAVPFTAAGGAINVLRNDQAIDGTSIAAGSGSLPAVLTTGITDAAYFENGDELAVEFVAVTASIGCYARFQGELVASAPAEGRNGSG